jgi:hypothetical protein
MAEILAFPGPDVPEPAKPLFAATERVNDLIPGGEYLLHDVRVGQDTWDLAGQPDWQDKATLMLRDSQLAILTPNCVSAEEVQRPDGTSYLKRTLTAHKTKNRHMPVPTTVAVNSRIQHVIALMGASNERWATSPRSTASPACATCSTSPWRPRWARRPGLTPERVSTSTSGSSSS